MKYIIGCVIITLCCYGQAALSQEWSLEKCIEYALINNQKVLAAEMNSSAEAYSKKSSSSQLLPQINATAGIDHYWEIPVQILPGELIGGEKGSFVPVRMGTPWMGNYGLQASMDLLNPKVWQDIKVSKLKHQASLEKYRSVRELLTKNVRMAFFMVQQEEEHMLILEEQLENYEEINRLIALQYDKGIIDKISLNQSKSLLKNRENALLNAEMQWKKALLDLKFWMDYPLNDSIVLQAKNEVYPIEMHQEFEPSLLADYDYQKSSIELARQSYRSSIHQLYPSLQFSAAYKKLGFGNSVEFISQDKWFSSGFVGLNLNVPLFSLHKMAYQPKMHKVRKQIAELEFETYLQEKEKAFIQEKLAMQQAWNSLLNQRENLQLAKENEQLSEQKVRNGLIDMIQLKQIQEDLSEAQDKVNKAEKEFLMHYVEFNYLQNND